MPLVEMEKDIALNPQVPKQQEFFMTLIHQDPKKKDVQKFEYVLVVIFDKNFKLQRIIELNWDQFMKLKRWHSTMQAWNLSISSELEKTGKTVYS